MASKLDRMLRVYRFLHRLEQIPKPSRSFVQRAIRLVVLKWFHEQMGRQFGAYIDPAAEIDPSTSFIHGFQGVFIGGKAVIGPGCVMHHRVTLGSTGASATRPVFGPTLGKNVFLGADVTLVGRCVIGDDAKIGAGVTLVDAIVPPGATIINKSAYDLTNKRFIYPQD